MLTILAAWIFFEVIDRREGSLQEIVLQRIGQEITGVDDSESILGNFLETRRIFMKNLKPKLARLLAAILVASSLTPSGMANAAPPAADTLESQEKTERFQDMDTSTASDAVNDQEALTQVSQTLKNDASGTCGDNLVWNLENGVLTISGTGSMKSSPWENRKAEIRSVVIENGVTNIVQNAFYGCGGITNVQIGNSVANIGRSAFGDCIGLVEMTIPGNVTVIEAQAFKNCRGLTNIEIEKGVVTIGSSAFADCGGLTSVTIPGSVTSVGYKAFYGCAGLTSAVIDSGVADIGESAFENCIGLNEITVPGSVTSIGEAAFRGCIGLKNAVIKSGVSKIEAYAFAGCAGLKKVEIENGLSTVGTAAFMDCGSLAEILLPGSLTEIGVSAFSGCESLTDITIPGSVTKIGNTAFQNCGGLKKVTIENGVENIGYRAFYNCGSLSRLTIPASVKSTGEEAFRNCGSLSLLTIKDGAGSIGDSAFSGCGSLKRVVLPGSITAIGQKVFQNCGGLRSVKIEDGITTIGQSAFEGCEGLRSLRIADSVTSIGVSAFNGCAGLMHLTIPKSVTSIGSLAFRGCGISELTIPGNVTGIGYRAFYQCGGLKRITIESGVTSIGEGAFQSCTGLKEAVIENSVTSIGESAFRDCIGLSDIVIPDSVTNIGELAFYSCDALANIYYEGDENGWQGIQIGRNNDPLAKAAIHYNSAGLPPFIYSNSIKVVLYIPCSEYLSIKNRPKDSQVVFNMTSGNLPKGVQLNPETGDIYGVPLETGEFIFGVEAVINGADTLRADITLTVEDNTDANVERISDSTFYEITKPVGEKTERGYLLTQFVDQELLSAGPADEFAGLWINGEKLISEEDYTIHVEEEGGTRLTIKGLTFKTKGKPGLNTIALEFTDGNSMEAAVAQNLIIEVEQTEEKPVESVTISPTDITMKIKEEQLLSVAITPGDAADKTVSWHSTNSDIAIVDDTGKVVAAAEGTAEIYCVSHNGNIESNHCRVTVTASGEPEKKLVESITISPSDLVLSVKSERTLSAAIYPADAADQTVTWHSTAPNIAAVDETGKVTAAAKGTAEIYCVSQDGRVESNHCTVKVVSSGSSGGGGGSSSGGGSGSGGSGGGSGSGSGGSSSGGSGGGPASNTSGSSTSTSSGNGMWINDARGWWYQKTDGTWPANTWYQIPYMGTLEWYYFDSQGYMVTGWLEHQGRWYYLNPMTDGTQGKMNVGWQQIDGKWYYFNELPDGSRGAMLTDTRIGGYYVNHDGVWIQ